MTDLLPCPFCGDDSLTVDDCSNGQHEFLMVICRACEADGPATTVRANDAPGAADKRAREAWNRRSSPSPVQEMTPVGGGKLKADKYREALDDLWTKSVEGPTDAWMMIPRVEWNSIFQGLFPPPPVGRE